MAEPMQRWVEAMRAERFEDAWDLCEASLRERDPSTRDDTASPYHLRWVWDGRPFDDRDVLVRCYHGLGDTLQFARYLPLLAERTASLTLEVQPRLIPLLEQLPGIDRFVPFDPAQPEPQSECDIEITELAFALRSAPDAVPPPYLQASRAALPAGTIGLCYGAGEWDPERCVPADLFRGLCERHRCLSLVAEPTDLPVLNPAGCPFDMITTAALVASVDLVITVDTMIAHLAGAMTRPTWLLLKADPDWRWTPGVTRSPWYPSMRIFSQPHAGEWEPVIAEVECALELSAPQNEGAASDGSSDQPVDSGLVG
jgi:ADP-heptose:LPS heptosyltransferase